MRTIQLIANLTNSSYQPVGLMWQRPLEVQRLRDSLITGTAYSAHRQYLYKTSQGKIQPDVLYRAVDTNYENTLTLIYKPQVLSLRVSLSTENTYYLDNCRQCVYRYSQKCTGGLIALNGRGCIAQQYPTNRQLRVDADMPWVMAELNLSYLPDEDYDDDDADSFLSLRTPLFDEGGCALSLSLRTGNTNAYGNLCMGYFMEECDPLGDLFRYRPDKHIDAAAVIAESLSRTFNYDYSVPKGDTASWLKNLRTNNTGENILPTDFYWGAVGLHPSGPSNTFMVEPGEQLLSWIRYNDHGVAIKTNRRYFLPATQTSIAHDDYNHQE